MCGLENETAPTPKNGCDRGCSLGRSILPFLLGTFHRVLLIFSLLYPYRTPPASISRLLASYVYIYGT